MGGHLNSLVPGIGGEKEIFSILFSISASCSVWAVGVWGGFAVGNVGSVGFLSQKSCGVWSRASILPALCMAFSWEKWDECGCSISPLSQHLGWFLGSGMGEFPAQPLPHTDKPLPCAISMDPDLCFGLSQFFFPSFPTFLSGNDQMKAENFEAAVSFYGKAIELNPANAVYFCNRY